MKKLVFVLMATTAAAQAPSLVGRWMGTLDVGPQKLRIALNVTANPAGALSATMDSLDQGAMGIPVGSISVTGDKVEFAIPAIGGSYEGTITGARRIVGKWSQGGASLPLNFEPAGAVRPPRRPQEPQPPFPYRSEDVTVVNGVVRLAGTFTWPPTGGPFPAVLLVTGSGPQDRDETLFGHKPFLLLSDYLTRAGVAVLRLDDRGTGKSTGSFKEAGLEDFTSDALAAVAWMKARKEVDAHKIGLIGHSEGGAVAPLAASKSKDVAFIILMAGPGVAFDQLLAAQAAALMRAGGASQAAIDANEKIQQKLFAILREEPDDVKAKERVKKLAEEMKAESPQGAAALEQQGDRLVSPEIRSLLAYNPAETLRKVNCPVLAIDGGHDLQVVADQNLPGIAAALAAGNNPDWTVEKLPGLNHLFQTAKTGAVSEYGQIEETMSPRALRVMAEWIGQVTR